jgi:hypothetical protein
MSRLAEATRPARVVRSLVRDTNGAGPDTEELERRLREFEIGLRNSVAVTYRESSLREYFESLAEQWQTATRFDSSLARATAHPCYRAIVELGDEIVPVLLEQLQRGPEAWFTALREITGEDPVEPKQRGDMRAMARAWINWGRSRGIIR